MASTPSRSPYLASRPFAVFSPTPFMPGILSELSPMSAFRSIMRAGLRPCSSMSLASSNSTVSVMPFLVSSTCVLSETSCSASRSPVTISVEISSFSAILDMVPSMSSAS